MTMTVVEIAQQAYASWANSFRAPKGWQDTEDNRRKLGEVLIDHVQKTGSADARDIADMHAQLLANGETFDIDRTVEIPNKDLGLFNIEDAAKFVKDNGTRFSTNPRS